MAMGYMLGRGGLRRKLRNKKLLKVVVGRRQRLYRGLLNTIPHVYNYKQNVVIPSGNISLGTFGAIGTAVGLDTTRILPTAGAATLGSAATFALKFLLSDLPQATTFTALYDQYKITKIVLRLYPVYAYGQFGQAGVATLAAASTNRAFLLVDYDDAIAPSNLLAMRDYQNVKEYDLNLQKGPIHVTFTPHIAIAAYAAGVFTSYANRGSQWCDCGSAAIEHYGVKIGIPQVATGNFTTGFDVEAEYYISFKNVR